jgi:hypothetical protein
MNKHASTVLCVDNENAPILMKKNISHIAVTFDNDEGSLLIQNGTSSRQVTNGPVELSACYTTESYGVSCNLEHPEHFDTLSTTSELSKQIETLFSTSWNNNYLYAAKLHLICLAVLVRIMFLLDYDFMFGQVRYMYFNICILTVMF